MTFNEMEAGMRRRLLRTVLLFLVKTMALSCNSGARATRVPSRNTSAIILDLDGTALDDSGLVRSATVSALQLYKKRGGQVGIATGRGLQQAEPAIGQIQPTLPTILMNGCALLSAGAKQPQVVAALDEETWSYFRKLDRKEPRIWGVVYYFKIAAIPDRDSLSFAAVARAIHLVPAYRLSVSDISADSLVKIVVVADSAYLSPLSQELSEKLSNARVVASTPITLEIMPKSVTKLGAIARVAREKGITLEEIVAIGDGLNDLEMIKGVGFGVAMSNGHPLVKEAADLVIGANTTDAIAKFIYSLLN